jgi:hypothetical protein
MPKDIYGQNLLQSGMSEEEWAIVLKNQCNRILVPDLNCNDDQQSA